MKINFWETKSGRSPVLEFIKQQDKKVAARLMKDIDHLEKQGINLMATPNKMKKLRGYRSLYELKTYFKGVYYRIIFTIINGEAWLLVGFKKKSSDTPPRFIETAVSRQKILQPSL